MVEVAMRNAEKAKLSFLSTMSCNCRRGSISEPTMIYSKLPLQRKGIVKKATALFGLPIKSSWHLSKMTNTQKSFALKV